jgi:PadR family transcriptional regulator AphA
VDRRELTPGEWAILALLGEGEAHGWALVRTVAPSGEIGRVWSVKRALVYRAIEVLTAWGLIEEAGSAQSVRGPSRTILRATKAGRKAVAEWLDEPVAHVRDARSLLLLKLLLHARSGSSTSKLLSEQARVLAATEAALEEQLRTAGDGTEAMLAAFRLETTRAVARFVASFSQ